MLATCFPKLYKSSLQIHLICGANLFHSKGSLYCLDLKPKQRSIQQRSIQCAKFLSTSVHLRDNTVEKIKERFSTMMTSSSRINIAACLVYEKCADSIDLDEFIKYFELPDTFQSWFLAVQLHVWMCITIGISEKHGRLFRNAIVENMWHDVEFRVVKLNIASSEKKRYLSHMVDQFQAALISFDEGILSNDMVLAATAWRTFFNFREVDPRLLESMVIYIRKQMCHLDSLHLEDVMNRGSISFLPLKSIVQSIGNDKSL